MSSLLNRKQAKQFTLHIAGKRAHKFTRVSPEFLDKCEANLKEFIRTSVHRLPSVGKTIR